MNIFFLHEDPEKAAELQSDVHVVKMIVETMQMLCTCLHFSYSPFIWPFELCKPTHVNHPSTKWVRFSGENYKWTIKHGKALCSEYTKRYNKVHKYDVYYTLLESFPIPFSPPIDVHLLNFNKIAYDGIPQNCGFAIIAIDDEILNNCGVYNEDNKLMCIDTYRMYYIYKMTTLKRKMRWYKKDQIPTEFIQLMPQEKRQKLIGS